MRSPFNPVTVIVVSDDPLARAGLSSLLENEEVVVLASLPSSELDGEEDEVGVEVDALLWDADPDLDADPIREQAVPVLTLITQEADPRSLLAAGAAGVLYRTASAEQVANGLRAVAAGLTVLAPRLLTPLLPETPLPDAPFDDLTPREVEVLGLISEGLSNKRIAKKLAISVNTVKFHVNALLSKFGVRTRTELAVRAVQQGQTFL